jgi:hypothetical protein
MAYRIKQCTKRLFVVLYALENGTRVFVAKLTALL